MPIFRSMLVGLVLFSVALAASAQPTFGPPKPGRRTPPPPPPPAQQADPSGDWAPDAQPDDPDEPPAMSDRDDARRTLVPSPEEWLEADPPRSAPPPAPDLEPGKTYAWRSADGLRFSYTVPVDLKPSDGADVIIICHPRGSDFRWGMANHLSPEAARERGSARLAFRPRNIVVSVDGVNADPRRPKQRWFACDTATAVRFRDFVLELTRTMPARRFFLYGCGGGEGGGGQFVTYFAHSFPALADGVIAYGAGRSTVALGRSTVPIVMLHGVKNGIVPFGDALLALQDNREKENKLVRLRALRSFNDYPNPVRVSECIDWLTGVRTDSPAEALAAVESMLTPKGGDEYDYLCPVWYTGAREILGRILDEPGPVNGESPFAERKRPTPAIKERAREIVRLLDAEAEAHIAALREWIPEPKRVTDLVLDGEPWLGHLIAARDDFRGIEPMEDFATSIIYDDALVSHEQAATELIAEWTTRSDEDNFAMVAATLPECCLYEGLPVDVLGKMRTWRRKGQAGELDLAADAVEGFELVTNWDEGYRKGLDAYQRIWRRWRFEPAKEAVPPSGR